MMSLLLAVIWSGVVMVGLAASATFERRTRLASQSDRPDLMPPRATWGSGLNYPPSRALTARALAGFARLIRRRPIVADHQRVLRGAARLLGTGSLVLAIAMLPVVGTWASAQDAPIVPLDPANGLSVLGILLLLVAFARVAVGLSERSPWSRAGSARQASRSIVGVALLAIVIAPLAIDAGSLRLHEIVADQQRPIIPLAWLGSQLGCDCATALQAWPLPAWNLFVQPITALLFAPAMALWTSVPRVDDPSSGSIGLAGLGLDADPTDLYWSGLDARLSNVLAAGLFVTLFLGAGAIPFVDPQHLVDYAAPYFGEGLPQLAVTGLYLGTFVIKLVAVLAVAARLGRIAATTRDDRAVRLATRRLMPIAWANLLLVAAITLWFENAGAFG